MADLSKLGREGDECGTCRAFWVDQGLEPKQLVAIAPTTEGGIPIVICPYCDGTPILQRNEQ